MFEVGDVVTLRSGGLAMTVEGVDGNLVTVIWHDDRGRLHSAHVLDDVLIELDFHDCEDAECTYH